MEMALVEIFFIFCEYNEKRHFFSLVTFITTLQFNIYHFLVNRVSGPLVRSEMAITLEPKFCLSTFIRYIDIQKEGYQGTDIALAFTRLVRLFLIPYFEGFS